MGRRRGASRVGWSVKSRLVCQDVGIPCPLREGEKRHRGVEDRRRELYDYGKILQGTHGVICGWMG